MALTNQDKLVAAKLQGRLDEHVRFLERVQPANAVSHLIMADICRAQSHLLDMVSKLGGSQ
jgi:hypothetical protein